MTSVYETARMIDEYMAFHYGGEYFQVPNYPARCARLCLQMMEGRPRERALDLGCAVGRSTFELARGFDRVTGIDLSAGFIDRANRLREQGHCDYFLVDEGEVGHRARADLEKLDLDPLRGRVEFVQGDAAALDECHGGQDLIFAGNLIDRLADPGAFLDSLHAFVRPGGLLVISSPYTLLPEFTPPEKWIGGFYDDGHAVSVRQGMTERLSPRFRAAATPEDVPFVIRETARKFQHSIAEMTFWERLDDGS